MIGITASAEGFDFASQIFRKIRTFWSADLPERTS
jgi:hypothetical protein